MPDRENVSAETLVGAAQQHSGNERDSKASGAETLGVGSPGLLLAGVVGLTASAVLTGCAPSPSCAGGVNPPSVRVTLDAEGWLQAHPSTRAIVACAKPYPCQRLLAKQPADPGFVGNVPASSPQGAAVTITVRALARSGRVLVSRSATIKPTATHQSSPCGAYDVVYARFSLAPNGQLGPAR
jgi:hypothetical protein